MNRWTEHVSRRLFDLGRFYAMVWGVKTSNDMGPLTLLETTLTGDRYVSILSDQIHSFVTIVCSAGS